MERDAVISDCGRYRYLLRRAWDHDRLRALFVMLNPSTAYAEQDDATIRSCIRLCKSWGYGSFEVVNLYGWRATDPRELALQYDAIGPKNDDIARAAIYRCDVAICAWGVHKMALHRQRQMWELINAARPAAFCLGTTKAGSPRHPLYMKSGTVPTVYRPDQMERSAA